MAASEKKAKKRPKPAVGLSFSDEDAGGPVLFKKRKKSIASREAAADVARELGEKGRGKGAEEYTGYGLSALKRANEAARERTKRVARSIEDEREQAERDAAAADALRRREEQRQAADAAIVSITATSFRASVRNGNAPDWVAKRAGRRGSSSGSDFDIETAGPAAAQPPPANSVSIPSKEAIAEITRKRRQRAAETENFADVSGFVAFDATDKDDTHQQRYYAGEIIRLQKKTRAESSGSGDELETLEISVKRSATRTTRKGGGSGGGGGLSASSRRKPARGILDALADHSPQRPPPRPPRGFPKSGSAPASPAASSSSSDEDRTAGLRFEREQLRKARLQASFHTLPPQPDLAGEAVPARKPSSGDQPVGESIIPPPLASLGTFDDQHARLAQQMVRMKDSAATRSASDSQSAHHLLSCRADIAELRVEVREVQARFDFLDEARQHVSAFSDCLTEKSEGIRSLLTETHRELAAIHSRARANRQSYFPAESSAIAAAESTGFSDAPPPPAAERPRLGEVGSGGRAEIDAVLEAALAGRAGLLADVDDAFAAPAPLLRFFARWAEKQPDSFRAAARSSLALALEPFALLDMATWDPLAAALEPMADLRSKPKLPEMPWFHCVSGDDESSPFGPGLRAVVVSDVVLPSLVTYVASGFDPLSLRQTEVVDRLLSEISAEAPQVQSTCARRLQAAAVSALESSLASLALPPVNRRAEEAYRVSAEATPAADDAPPQLRSPGGVVGACAFRWRACLALVRRAGEFPTLFPEALVTRPIMEHAFEAVLAPYLLRLPLRSFADLTAVSDTLREALSEVPSHWYSVVQCGGDAEKEESVRSLTLGVQNVLRAASAAFKALRATVGREQQKDMVEAARSFKQTCDLLGNPSVLRMMLG